VPSVLYLEWVRFVICQGIEERRGRDEQERNGEKETQEEYFKHRGRVEARYFLFENEEQAAETKCESTLTV